MIPFKRRPIFPCDWKLQPFLERFISTFYYDKDPNSGPKTFRIDEYSSISLFVVFDLLKEFQANAMIVEIVLRELFSEYFPMSLLSIDIRHPYEKKNADFRMQLALSNAHSLKHSSLENELANCGKDNPELTQMIANCLFSPLHFQADPLHFLGRHGLSIFPSAFFLRTESSFNQFHGLVLRLFKSMILDYHSVGKILYRHYLLASRYYKLSEVFVVLLYRFNRILFFLSSIIVAIACYFLYC